MEQKNYTQTNNSNEIQVFTLSTEPMVEVIAKTIKDYNGELTRETLWNKVNSDIDWPTYIAILTYLKEKNWVVVDQNGILVNIFNPQLVQKYLPRKDLDVDDVRIKRERL